MKDGETNMSTIQLWCCLLGIQIKDLTKQEQLILEAQLFINICDEIKDIFKEQHKD